MSILTKSNSLIDEIAKTMESNYEFFDSNPLMKDVITEVLDLTNDAIDYIPNANEAASPEQVFSSHGFIPISYGIVVSLLSGNIVTCFTQLRTLVEFYAMIKLSKKLFPNYNSFEQMRLIKKRYRIATSKMIKNFDPKAHQLWKSLSSWSHGITYSNKAIRNVVKGNLTLGSIIQPATYDKDDLEQLLELKRQIRTFRKILQK